MMKQFLLLAGAAALASAAPAFAKPKHAGHGKGHHTQIHGGNGHVGYGVGGCPPGLAKKGCIPPGQAKKLFNVGQRVPLGYGGFTPYGALPYDLRRQYGLGEDYRYIYRDNYLYQIDPTTYVVRRILNAIL